MKYRKKHYFVILSDPFEVKRIKFVKNVRKLIVNHRDRVRIVDRITENYRLHHSRVIYRQNPGRTDSINELKV